MSLINDALKRGSNKPQPRPDLPPGVPIMSPAPGNQRSYLGWIVAAVILAGGVGLFFLLRPKPQEQAQAAPVQSATQSSTQPPAAAVSANPVQTAANVLNKVAERNEEGAAIAEKVASTPAVPTSAATPAPKPAEPVPAKPAELKLQAIYFRMKDPTAVLNGKTVRPGQVVDGAKLLAIHRTSVDVEVDGTTKTLSLK